MVSELCKLGSGAVLSTDENLLSSSPSIKTISTLSVPCKISFVHLSPASFKPILIKTKQKVYVPDSMDHLTLITGPNTILQYFGRNRLNLKFKILTMCNEKIRVLE